MFTRVVLLCVKRVIVSLCELVVRLVIYGGYPILL
jgi:hypothetical protein